jgi:hypothetical protein
MKTVPMIMGALAAVALSTAAAHAQELTHAKHVAKYEGTASCVSATCHEGAAKAVAESLHYQQMAIPQFLEGWDPGKPAGMMHSY